MIVEFTVLAASLVAVLLIAAYAVRTGVAPMPTSPKVKAVMLAAIPADLAGPIFELGSGWGTLAFALARRFPASPVVACELSPIPWLISRLRLFLRPLPNLAIRRADFRAARLEEAALVVCYLGPAAMRGLKGKFESELAAGALVLSNTFRVPGWRPAAAFTAADLYRTQVYLYRVPVGAAGEGRRR